MRRWFLAILPLVPLAMVGQSVVTQSGTVTSSGQAIPVAQPGAPLVITPEISFRTVSPSPMGASNATANNIAGATNATFAPPVVSAAPTQVEYVTPYPSVVGAGSSYASEMNPANAPSGVATRLQGFDRGAGQFNSVYDLGAQPEASLGELAREWRQKKAALNARTYTNEDINRIQQQNAGGGLSGTAVNAGNSTNAPATPGQPGSNIGAPAAPSTATPENAAPPQPPAQPAPPPPQAAVQQQPMGSQGQQSPNVQEQTAPEAQNQAAQGGKELPGTASPLPALLLLGVGAGSIGFMTRRKQRSR